MFPHSSVIFCQIETAMLLDMTDGQLSDIGIHRLGDQTAVRAFCQSKNQAAGVK